MGPVSPHRFTAAMVTVKVVFIRALFGFSLTVITVLVHSPHAVVMFCIPDVEVTLMSKRSLSNWSKFCGCNQASLKLTLPLRETPSALFTATFSGAVGLSAIKNQCGISLSIQCTQIPNSWFLYTHTSACTKAVCM